MALEFRRQIEFFRAEGQVQLGLSTWRGKPATSYGQMCMQLAGASRQKAVNGESAESNLRRVRRDMKIDGPIDLDIRLPGPHMRCKRQHGRGAFKPHATVHVIRKRCWQIGAKFAGIQPGDFHFQLKPAIRQRHPPNGFYPTVRSDEPQMAQIQRRPG